MAQNIAKKFYLKAYNRSPNKMVGLDKSNIQICKTLNDACEGSDTIITVLPNDNEVFDVINKIKDLIKKGSTFIDMSSTKVSTAKKIYEILIKREVNFLDSPVSGGPEGAKSASLAIMVGGSKKKFEENIEIFNLLGKATFVGSSGSGQILKLCNQIIVGITIGAVAEAIVLCEKNKIEPSNFIKAVTGGLADSKILRNHGSRMINKDFIPRGKSSTHLKDMINILELAKENNLNLPISNLIKNMYQNLEDKGLGNNDHSALYKEILGQNK